MHVLLINATSQAPYVGWETPCEYSLLLVAVVHLGGFAFWEGKCAKDPILPLDIWGAKSFTPMLVASFFSFMSVGIFVWYCNIWNLILRRYSIMLDSATWVPLAIGGTISALTCAWLIPRLEARYILMIGSGCVAVSSLLISTMPDQQTYWAQMFPAICIFAFGPDFIFTAAQIITSNSVAKHQQGIAGSLIGTILFYGQSTGIGFAGTVETYTNNHASNPGPGYRHGMYLAIGLSIFALILASIWVQIPRDDHAGTKYVREVNQLGETQPSMTDPGLPPDSSIQSQ